MNSLEDDFNRFFKKDFPRKQAEFRLLIFDSFYFAIDQTYKLDFGL